MPGGEDRDVNPGAGVYRLVRLSCAGWPQGVIWVVACRGTAARHGDPRAGMETSMSRGTEGLGWRTQRGGGLWFRACGGSCDGVPPAGPTAQAFLGAGAGSRTTDDPLSAR